MNLFTNWEQMSDSELVQLYKSKNKTRALGELYNRYAHLVLGLCIKYLKDEQQAEDAVSHIFEKLMVDLKKHEVKHFKSWIYMVSKNHCLMILRQKKYETSLDQSSFEPVQETELEIVQERERQYQKLEESITELPEEQRICIDLFYLQQNSYRQIADLTGFDIKKVKSYIQNGKRNLKNLMTVGDGRAI